jgi:microcin C transport system permease protein
VSLLDRLHPVTRRRLMRFRRLRRAHLSFWLLAGLYALSLFSEFIANNQPLVVKAGGRLLFPAARDWAAPLLGLFRVSSSYSEHDVLGNNVQTRADFRRIVRSDAFKAREGYWMIFPPVPFGADETLQAEDIPVSGETLVEISRDPRVGSADLFPDLTVERARSAALFLAVSEGAERGAKVPAAWDLPDAISDGIAVRFRNERAPAVEAVCTNRAGVAAVVALQNFEPRARVPRTVRLYFREPGRGPERVTVVVDAEGKVGRAPATIWPDFGDEARKSVLDLAARRKAAPTAPEMLVAGGESFRLHATREEARFPFRPCQGHPMGLDSSGRDVLARLLYAFRIAVSFGLILVTSAIMIGTTIGAMQGYFAGWVDLVGQRMTEIWQAMPFLYIIMLAGSVFGRSFLLLLVVYALFNWIGMSYYMRAEFLRLRRMPYVEAARCMGLRKRRIIFRHILPNALVPIITFFPFSLVGAIGSLSALDYLGFGLPPPTASWGEMFFQAQQQESAWWLILFPFLALFGVILLGVFIGEGVREAFDPRRYAKIE